MAKAQDDIEALRKLLKEQSDYLQKLSEAPLPYGHVVHRTKEDGKIYVSNSGGNVTLVNDTGLPLGTSVLIHPETGQVVKAFEVPSAGPVKEVSRVLANKLVELSSQGSSVIVPVADKIGKLREGDRVRLDAASLMVVELVEKAPKPPHVVDVTPVTWDMVGGLSEAKRLLREAIELPYQHPKVFEHYGKRPVGGILMYGPPGCGKTLLAKACSTAIGSPGGFISVKGPEVLDPYVGVAEATVRDLFRQAREYKAKTGKRAVVFVDEAEAILGHRGGRFNQMEKTIVPAFLAEMDGLGDSGATVILATNREDQLDPAVVRDGRVDFKVEVTRPDKVTAHEVLSIHLASKPVAPGFTRDFLATQACDALYCDQLARLPYSGALLAGVVEKASTHAIRRDLEAGKMTGLTSQDVSWAVDVTARQELVQMAA